MKKKRVLYGVLNWGLGHASRSKPVINYLLKNNFEVTLASDGLALELLKKEFPQQSFIDLPSYNPKYSNSKIVLPFKLLCQLPKLLRTIKKENTIVEKLVEKESYDLIISDNRYGFYSAQLPSIIITHQLKIKSAFGNNWINQFNDKLLSNFSKVWVPDVDSSLSGDLSNIDYSTHLISQIGWLSSYSKSNIEQDIDALIVLSGPEPQRSILESKLSKIIPKDQKVILVRGVDSNITKSKAYHEVYGLCGQSVLQGLLNRSKKVISRSGYSSLMDYKVLKIPAIVIPTPGQTEQEYLAHHLKDDKQFKVVLQKNLSYEIFNWEPQTLLYNAQKESLNIKEVKEEALQNALNQVLTMRA